MRVEVTVGEVSKVDLQDMIGFADLAQGFRVVDGLGSWEGIPEDCASAILVTLSEDDRRRFIMGLCGIGFALSQDAILVETWDDTGYGAWVLSLYGTDGDPDSFDSYVSERVG